MVQILIDELKPQYEAFKDDPERLSAAIEDAAEIAGHTAQATGALAETYQILADAANKAGDYVNEARFSKAVNSLKVISSAWSNVANAAELVKILYKDGATPAAVLEASKLAILTVIEGAVTTGGRILVNASNITGPVGKVAVYAGTAAFGYLVAKALDDLLLKTILEDFKNELNTYFSTEEGGIGAFEDSDVITIAGKDTADYQSIEGVFGKTVIFAGTDGDDSIVISPNLGEKFEILAGGGNDHIDVRGLGLGAGVIIRGGAGNDTISTSQGSDFIDGNIGDDTVTYFGQGAAEVIFASGDSSQVEVKVSSTLGSNNTDTLVNIENLKLGFEDDVVQVDAALLGKLREDLVIDGGGQISNEGDIIDFSLNASAVVVEGTSLRVGNAEFVNFETVVGSEFDDRFYGTSGGESFDGGEGDDVLIGGKGIDTLLGGEDEDVLRGDDDNVTDYLDGGDDADRIYAGTNDIVVGGDGDDRLFYKGVEVGSAKLGFHLGHYTEFLSGEVGYRYGDAHYFFGSYTGTKDSPELILINTGRVLFGIDARGQGFAIKDFEAGDYGIDIEPPDQNLREAFEAYKKYGLSGPGSSSRFISEPYAKLLSSLKSLEIQIFKSEVGDSKSFSINLGGHALAIINRVHDGVSGLPQEPLSSSNLSARALATPSEEVEAVTDYEYLEGTDGDDTLQGNQGGDILVGGAGSDIYVWRPEDGDDSIIERESDGSEIDVLRLIGVDAEQLRFKKTENDLTITYTDPDTGNNESIFITDQFKSDGSGVEEIEFDNGLVWDSERIEEVAGESSNLAPLYFGEREFEIEIGSQIEIDIVGLSEDLEGQEVSIIDVFSFGGQVYYSEDGKISYSPPEGFIGSEGVYVTISDGEIEKTVFLKISVVEPNKAVVVSSQISDQQVAEEASWRFEIPADAFFDADGDIISYSLSLEDGSDLPSWLYFEAETRTLSGTPPQDFNGTLNVRVTASDGASEASDVFVLEITPVNDAPVIADSLDDQSVAEDTAVNFVLPEDVFTDVDGDDLTLSASLSDGSALPAWLSFDPDTRTFSGTPPQDYDGSVDITVTASDGELTASDTFTLDFTPVNDAPVIAEALADQTSDEDAVLSFVLPEDAFTDVDGDTLNLSATLANGTALPAWLSFDAETRTFSGTPPQDFNGVLSVSVTASDGFLSASDTFELEITPVNDAPLVAEALADQASDEDVAVSFVLPEGAFSDVDGDSLVLSASLADGAELPNWLSFDAATRSFTGTPPQNYNGALDIRVTASDGALETSDVFTLDINAVNDAPVAVSEGGFVVGAGISVTFAAAGLLANDVDVDGDALTITSVTSTSGNATVEIDANGNVVYTADTGFVGEDTFTYTISDGELTSTAEVSVIVEADNPYEGWVQGTDGNDWMFGNLWSSNQLYGAGGNDFIFGGFYGDQLAGGTGNDRIWGNFGNDELYGNEGNDRLYGGFGCDTLSGGAGDDRLWGGWGRDTFVYESGDGRDKIMDFETGFSWGWFRSRGDSITIDVEGINSFVDLMATATQEGGSVVFDFGNGDELVLAHTRLAALDKDAFTFY